MRQSSFDVIGERACRRCGCTEHRACVDRRYGPCWWVELDLCSHCARLIERRRGALILAAVVAAALLIALAGYLGVRLG